MPEVRDGPPSEGWDDDLTRLGGHVLQSQGWARFQQELGHRVLHCAAASGSWMGNVEQLRGVRHLYVPYGPTMLTADTLLADSLRDAGHRCRADFIRVEPLGAAASSWLGDAEALPVEPTQPRHTWVLDLQPDIDTLRSGLEKGHRWRINAAGRKGVTIAESHDSADVETFLALLQDTTERAHFRPQRDEHYRTLMRVLGPSASARLYVARLHEQAVAASIVLDFGGTRYYLHSAADQEVNRRVGAAVPLLWTMITDAKALGAHRFDFWGVAPSSDPRHPWAGISAFKRGFGGELVERAGTWEIPLRRLRYRAYAMARRLRRR